MKLSLESEKCSRRLKGKSLGNVSAILDFRISKSVVRTTKPNRSAFVKNDNFLPEHGLKLMLQLKKPKHNEADR